MPKKLPLDSADILGLPLFEIKAVNCEEINVAMIDAMTRKTAFILIQFSDIHGIVGSEQNSPRKRSL